MASETGAFRLSTSAGMAPVLGRVGCKKKLVNAALARTQRPRELDVEIRKPVLQRDTERHTPIRSPAPAADPTEETLPGLVGSTG